MYINEGRIMNDFIVPNKKQYTIPVYQRNYEWSKEQCKKRECDQSCVSNIRQVLTRESRMVSPNLCPRPLSRYDHGADFMPAFFFVFYYISFFVTVHDPELIDD